MLGLVLGLGFCSTSVLVLDLILILILELILNLKLASSFVSWERSIGGKEGGWGSECECGRFDWKSGKSEKLEGGGGQCLVED